MSEINTTTTAPAPVTPPAGEATPPPAAAPADWTTGLSDEYKGYVQNKGFKDVGAVLESYKHSESLIGKLSGASKDRILALPDKEDAPEWSGIFNKLGRPEKAEGYKIPVPEGDDGSFAKQFAPVFHEAGLSQKQVEKLAAKWNEHVTGTITQSKESEAQQTKAQVEAVKKEWGAAYEQNLKTVDAAAIKFGMDEKQVSALKQAMGVDGALKFLHKVGSGLGEHGFEGSGNTNTGFGVLSPVAAQERIKSLMQDGDFSKRYMNGELPAMNEMKKLHEMAFPQH